MSRNISKLSGRKGLKDNLFKRMIDTTKKTKNGKVLVIREDVGRHNALDKVIGHSHLKSIFDTKNQFIACSGRLSFELVQKTLMANIGLLMGVGAPTSLAIDLAKRFDMTLIGFVKSDSFNIYCGENRILK